MWFYINAGLAKDESLVMPNPPKQLAIELAEELKKQNIDFKGKIIILKNYQW